MKQNNSAVLVQVGAIYAFAKTPEALSAEQAVQERGIWADWAAVMRAPAGAARL